MAGRKDVRDLWPICFPAAALLNKRGRECLSLTKNWRSRFLDERWYFLYVARGVGGEICRWPDISRQRVSAAGREHRQRCRYSLCRGCSVGAGRLPGRTRYLPRKGTRLCLHGLGRRSLNGNASCAAVQCCHRFPPAHLFPCLLFFAASHPAVAQCGVRKREHSREDTIKDSKSEG